MLKNTLLLILSYLLGSIPSGLWIGQAFFKKNLREHGSGNTGTTNTFRVLGTKAGIVVFLTDFFKGTIATLLPILFHAQGLSPIVFGLCAVLGHTFPIFANFRGGKAVATSAGMMLGFAPGFCLYLCLIFGITLYLTSMVSMASIVGSILGILGALIFPAFHFILPSYDPVFLIVVLFLGTFVIYRHRDNIQRIRQKSENLVPFGLNLTHQKRK